MSFGMASFNKPKTNPPVPPNNAPTINYTEATKAKNTAVNLFGNRGSIVGSQKPAMSVADIKQWNSALANGPNANLHMDNGKLDKFLSYLKVFDKDNNNLYSNQELEKFKGANEYLHNNYNEFANPSIVLGNDITWDEFKEHNPSPINGGPLFGNGVAAFDYLKDA